MLVMAVCAVKLKNQGFKQAVLLFLAVTPAIVLDVAMLIFS